MENTQQQWFHTCDYMTPGVESLNRFKQPEYTGENRCLPCTVVNTLIAAVGTIAIGIATAVYSTPPVGLTAGVAVFGLSMLTIYLRGYLVPGTPELTKQYFPPWLLSLFGKDPAEDEPVIASIDPERELLNAGALEECKEVDDLCLTEAFRVDWDSEIRRLRENRTDRKQLLELLDVDESNVEFQEHGDAFQAFVDGTPVGTWESEAAYLADLGGALALQEYHPNWRSMAIEAKSELLSGLRLFIEDCPACGGEPTFATDTVESCCSQYEVAAVSCSDCDARLFETRV
jgi:hypothetical protein